MKKFKGIKNEVLELEEKSYVLRRRIHQGLDEDECLHVAIEVTNMSYAYEKIIDKLLEELRKGR